MPELGVETGVGAGAVDEPALLATGAGVDSLLEETEAGASDEPAESLLLSPFEDDGLALP